MYQSIEEYILLDIIFLNSSIKLFGNEFPEIKYNFNCINRQNIMLFVDLVIQFFDTECNYEFEILSYQNGILLDQQNDIKYDGKYISNYIKNQTFQITDDDIFNLQMIQLKC